MSGHIPLYQNKCRVTFDTTFRGTRSNVESHSTRHSAVPDQMSSHIQHDIPLYQSQCRVTFDTTFRCTTSNVESHSTRHSAVPHQMSSHIRHDIPVYQIKCRFTLNTSLRCTRANVELHSTPLSALPDRMSNYRVADKSLARPARKQTNVSVRMAWISFGALLCRKNKLDESSRLHVVEIARVPDMLPSLFPSWSG